MLAADVVDILTSLFCQEIIYTQDSNFLICFVWRENLQWNPSIIQLNDKKLIYKFSKMSAKNLQ